MIQEDRAAMLHFIYNSKTVCVLVNHDLALGEFVLQVPFYPPIESVQDYQKDNKRCLQIIKDSLSTG